MTSIAELQTEVHKLARNKGWYDDAPRSTSLFPRNRSAEIQFLLGRLALIHSEVSEAVECVRDPEMHTAVLGADGKPEGLAPELADIVIRVLDLAGYLEIDMERHILEKHRYNLSRSYRHGGKLA
jgi:NTP pyrophosphatase (non-canonical NTP hydrolase)